VPAWITIYLHRAPPELTPETIQHGIGAADWWTLGEGVGLDDEDEVDAFMDSIEWSAEPLELRFPERRPIQFHVHDDAERVRVEIAELDERDLDIPDAVREHMKRVACVVALEMAWTQLETMFEVVGFEIAYWLAETCGGVILGTNDRWFDGGAHRWDPY
jgi:hypothetical protein